MGERERSSGPLRESAAGDGEATPDEVVGRRGLGRTEAQKRDGAHENDLDTLLRLPGADETERKSTDLVPVRLGERSSSAVGALDHGAAKVDPLLESGAHPAVEYPLRTMNSESK